MHRGSVNQTAHVVLMRFNARLDDSSNPRGLDEHWLTHRLEMFDRYASPSISQQSVRADAWLVLCDARSPGWFRNALSERARAVNMEPVYLEDRMSEVDGCPEALRRVLRSRIRPDTRSIITTRIDNDDAVRWDYLARAEAALNGHRERTVTFPLGYQLHRGVLSVEISRGSHFPSRIEPYDSDWNTVLERQHNTLYEVSDVRQVWAPPVWIEVIHDANLANKPRRGLPVDGLAVAAQFGLSPDEFEPISRRRLRLAQGRFFVRAPKWAGRKAFDRVRFHGPFRRDRA